MQPATITTEMLFWRTEKDRPHSSQPGAWRRLRILPAMPKLAAAALPLQEQTYQPLATRMLKLGMVFGAHAALVALALQHAPMLRLALPEPVAVPLAVRLIEVPPLPLPATVKIPVPVASPAKPLLPAAQPAMRRPQSTIPLPMTPAAAPSQPAVAATRQSGEAAPVAATAPAAPSTPSPAPAALSPAPAPAATTAARFDADYLQNPEPAYPALSRRMREEGKILLQVKVSATGSAEQVQIKQGSGFPRLDEAALSTVRQWRFVPARRGDEAIAASVMVPIVFRLNS